MTNRHLAPVPTPGDLTPAHDLDAERAVLGAALLSPTVRAELAGLLTGTEFYHPAHELIWDAIARTAAAGTTPDVITVADTLGKDLGRAGGQAALHALLQAVPTASNGSYYAAKVKDLANARRDADLAARLALLAQDPTPEARAKALELHRAALDTTPVTDTGLTPLPVDQFLTGTDDDYDWLVPWFIERQDRVIVTAAEGAGKSTLLRQWGVQLAAGIHPFTEEPLPAPVRVLILDLENSERQTRRALRPLTLAAGPRLTDPGNLLVLCKPDGVDLTDAGDLAWVDRLIAASQPDLVITGPLYKLAGGDPNDEKEAKPASKAIDWLRDRHDCAFLLEAHTKKGENAQAKTRAKEPFGWSGWMRWPEIGIHLGKDGEISHWRGLRDQARAEHIPTMLQRGGRWPWMAVTDPDSLKFEMIKKVCNDLGKIASVRELQEATGIPRTSISRILKNHGQEVEAMRYRLDGGGDDGY